MLSGMIGLGVRYDVLERNLVRDVGRIESGTSSARALTVDEARDLRAKLHADKRCQDWDLVDFTDFMLATGHRTTTSAGRSPGPERRPSWRSSGRLR